MKIVAMYESFDHEIFKSEEDCRQYEEDILRPRQNISRNISFFDEEGGLIQQPSLEDEDYLRELDEAVADAREFIILRELSQEERNFLYKEIGIYIPKETGHYIWDDKENDWISFKEDIQNFLNKWHLKDISQIKAQMVYSN